MGYDIFVSYSSQDKHFVDALVNHLENLKIRCWYAPRDIPPGVTWPSAITTAIREIPVMVLVFSASANNSQEVSRELTLASTNKCLVIPVRIENVPPSTDLEYYLTNRHWLDVYGLENESAFTQVSEVVMRYEHLFHKDGETAASSGSVTVKAAPKPAPNVVPAASAKPRLGLARPLGLALACLLATACFFWYYNQPGPDQLLPAPNVAVYYYSNPENITVRTLRLDREDSDQFLVEISGLNDRHDGRIFLCRQVSNDIETEYAFSAQINGREEILFRVNMGRGTVHKPGSMDRYYVDYIKSSDAWVDVQDFYAAYLAQEQR